jgi:hypothetical protein
VAQVFGDARRIGEESKALDGLLLARVGAPGRQREPRAPPLAPLRTARGLDQHELLDARLGRGVVQCDVGSQGMSDEGTLPGAKLCEQRLEVAVECSHLEGVGMVRIAMPAEVECHDVVVARKLRNQMIPPVKVGAAAVQQHDPG